MSLETPLQEQSLNLFKDYAPTTTQQSPLLCKTPNDSCLTSTLLLQDKENQNKSALSKVSFYQALNTKQGAELRTQSSPPMLT